MRPKLIILLWAIFNTELVIGANNIVLNCPCQLKVSCFKPLDISKVNETSCADENYVRCCGVSEPFVKQIVVITSSASIESSHGPNVSVVFPSEMSGIPQTTPLNMPDDYMIQMIDRQSGNEMLLVFPRHEESSSEVPTTTVTTSATSATTIAAIETTEIPNSTPNSTTTIREIQTTTPKSKPKRIPARRRKPNSNNRQHESQSEQKLGAPKANVKIYDVSRRKNFLRRQPDTAQPEFYEPIPSVTTQLPITRHLINDKLRNKIDQDHKTMIETLKSILTVNDNSSLRRPLDTGKSHRFKSFEGLVNVEMAKVIDNMKMKQKPYRGHIKWAALPDSHQEQKKTTSRPITTTIRTRNSVQTTPKPKYNYPALPYNEFEKSPTLLADFKPSPLWSLQAENLEIVEVNTRTPRLYATSPFEHVGAESGFTPVIHNGESLKIVGPVPQGFKSQTDDSQLNYELPID